MQKYKRSLFVIFSLVGIFTYIPNTVWAETPVNLSINVENNVGTIVDGGENLNLGVGAVVSVALGDSNTAVATGIQVNSQDPMADNHVGIGSVSSGGGNNATGAWTTAIGYGNTSLGAGATAGTVDRGVIGGTAIGLNSQANENWSVALGAYSIADRPLSVSVGGVDPENGQPFQRQITNVAPGTYGTDAVNMNQLRTVNSKVDRVGASAAAFSALAPLAYDPKEPTQYSAGIGTYNGTGAFAVGVYHYTKPDVMLNAAISISNDGWEKHARVGISWRTGGSKAKEIAPAVEPKESIEDRVKRILEENKVE